METLLSLFSSDLVYASIRLTTPLLFAAMGGVFSERSGVLNIGLEGMMLAGALAAVIGSHQTGDPWMGVLYALIAGGITALLHAVITITFRADQVVSGVAINILMLGLTGVVFRAYFGITTAQIRVPAFIPMPVPLLSEIPFLGTVLFDHIPLVYIAFLLVPLVHFTMFHTTWGLKIRAVGEHPRAADTVGVNVFLIRYLCVIFSGMLAGVGGAVMTIGFLNTFMENITAGRGFIAFSAIIFGKWNPLGAFLACLLFGAADAFQLRIQAFGLELPYQLVVMLPYVVTLLALFGVGRARAPAASCLPYVRDSA
ncbi:MAG: ABC transporter permease [Chloroflexi bacterium]|nr:ABC transporter permease [Chloroflexota bacterium]MCL5075380.1 ABC transporter permease [Chloroflexota bacterium]